MADPISHSTTPVARAPVAVAEASSENNGFYTDPSKSKTPASTSTQQSKFGVDFGTQCAFLFQENYQMPVLDLSARVSYSHHFSDRFTLRTSLGGAAKIGSSRYDYAEDLGAPVFEEMEDDVEYEFSREHVTSQAVGGALFGVITPEAEVSGQLLFTGETRWTPHLTLGFNQVTSSDTVTTVTETKTPDSDLDENTEPDLTRIYTEADPVVSQAIGVTLDVVPISLKIKSLEVGLGAEFLFNANLDGVCVLPMVEVNWQPNFLLKEKKN